MFCPACNQERELIEFHVKSSDKSGMTQYRSKICRACDRRNKVIIKALRQQHPPRPLGSPCDLCGCTCRKVVLDHCHESQAYRGEICQPCNIALGLLGDTEEGVLKAYRYLQKANGSDL
jgi:hypothetical protein